MGGAGHLFQAFYLVAFFFFYFPCLSPSPGKGKGHRFACENI